MTKLKSVRRAALTTVGLMACAVLSFAGPVSAAGGEAGSISLRDQGFFWVGVRTKQVEVAGRAAHRRARARQSKARCTSASSW